MDFAAYVAAAAATTIYPTAHWLTYPTLGLAGEVAELHDATCSPPDVRAAAVAAEAGDVCWYLAAVVRDAGLDPDQVARTAATHRRRLAGQPPAARPLPLLGVLAEQVKKTVRGGDTAVPAHRRDAIADALAGLLAHVQLVVGTHGTTLADVLAANLDKLAGRAAAGTLHGDGHGSDRRTV